MEQVMWWDPQLQGMPRAMVINRYFDETEIWLHEVFPEPEPEQ